MEISATLATSSPTVSKIFRRGAVQKLGLRVDLGKCYALRILLQKLASTQPRTSPGKIANFREIFGNFGDAGDFFADRFEKFSTRGGAKAGGAWRSRQMLHVAYFVAKYGLYPAENEPLHFQNFRNFSKIFKNFQKFKIFKIFENFQNRWTRSGAKAGGAGSSRQELPVAYFVAKYGLHPAENEPLHFQNFRNFSKIFKNFQKFKIFKIFENFQNRWTRSGAKAGGAGSSRQELPVAYFVAKYGLHPAENEPRQVWQILADFRH